jgi:hypothetical protein
MVGRISGPATPGPEAFTPLFTGPIEDRQRIATFLRQERALNLGLLTAHLTTNIGVLNPSLDPFSVLQFNVFVPHFPLRSVQQSVAHRYPFATP